MFLINQMGKQTCQNLQNEEECMQIYDFITLGNKSEMTLAHRQVRTTDLLITNEVL